MRAPAAQARGAVAGAPPFGVRIGAAAPRGPQAGCGDRACVCDAQRASLRSAVEANRGRLGLPPRGQPRMLAAGAAERVYRFYPMAGALGVDTFNGGFVDLDPGPGIADYACRPFTYDGHGGIDTELRSFGEQFVGVPVFAARDGTVVFAQDGWPDTNVAGGVQGNIVVIDHGDDHESQYFHLKLGSVAVALGEQVVEGRQIGMVGSSGNSFGPHLHFETVRFEGGGWTVVEPFAGACRPGESRWLEQSPLDSEALLLHDFGITRTWLDDLPQPWWEPWPLPTDGQVQADDADIVFWWRVYNFPQDALIRVRFWRPDDSLAWDAQWNWGNAETWRVFKNWFAFPLSLMEPVVGTWRLRFEIDGIEVMDTPIEVVARADPGFNRAPLPVGLSFAPAEPTEDDVLFCRIATVPGKEDPDWDIVRYRYEWRVNGAVVRDTTTAAQSDALPRGAAPPGALVECTVTPDDGAVAAPSSSASVRIAGGLPGDLDGNGIVDGADLGILLGAWGACPGCAQDLDGDGQVGGADLGLLLGNWTG